MSDLLSDKDSCLQSWDSATKGFQMERYGASVNFAYVEQWAAAKEIEKSVEVRENRIMTRVEEGDEDEDANEVVN